MSSHAKALLRPVIYPEFTVPGALCLMGGITLGLAAWQFSGFSNAALLGMLLICTGICLLFRTILGTVLMTFVLGLLIWQGKWDFGASWKQIACLLFSLTFLASMIWSIFAQAIFHLIERKTGNSVS